MKVGGGNLATVGLYAVAPLPPSTCTVIPLTSNARRSALPADRHLLGAGEEGQLHGGTWMTIWRSLDHDAAGVQLATAAVAAGERRDWPVRASVRVIAAAGRVRSPAGGRR